MSKGDLEKKASAVIKTYLITQNRPYSVVDVHTNLRGEFNKPTVQRALELLAEAKEISDKVIGKQKIYYANQDLLPTADDSELRAFDERIKAGGERLKEVQAKVKTLETQMKTLSGTMSTAQMASKIVRLEKENAAARDKLVSARASDAPQITPDQLQAVQAKKDRSVREWRKRKHISDEMFNAVSENCAKKKKDLIDDMGIDTDEAANVKLP